jgi:SAM-dependent methyltransferase
VGAWFLKLQSEITHALLAEPPRSTTVLDVGGGHAQLTPMLLAAGYEVTVLGSGPGAKRQLEPFLARGEVRYEVGNLVALPFPDRSFDTALSFRLLPHCTAWPRLIAELCRVARHAVILDYPSRRSVNAVAERTFGLKKRLEGNTRPFTLFTPEEIERAFVANGFRVRRARAQFLWPMVLHRTLRSAAVARALEMPPRWLGLTDAWGSPVIVRAERMPVGSQTA